MARQLILVALFFPAMAGAWGGVGHEVVCEIAFDELNDIARRKVIRLMRLDDEYKTFATACNWPDRPRKRDEDHYVNVTRSHRAITVDKCELADTCLFPAIDYDVQVLRDPNTSDRQKLEALKFLGHWVGDIHQPMHVSYQDDRGANSIDMQGELCDGSLHFAWDVCIIRDSLGDQSANIADALRQEVSAANRTSWQYDSPVEWANESYQIVTAPGSRYCRWREGSCWYGVNNMTLQRGEARRSVVFDAQFVSAHADTVRLRLKMAGIRLGALLNTVLREPGDDDASAWR